MKLKSFGLVEAIIATAIIMLFLTGMFYLSAQASRTIARSSQEDLARVYAQDFISRVDVLNSAGYLEFKSNQSQEKIPMSCLETARALECQGKILAEMPKNLYPFGSLVEASSQEYSPILKSEDKVVGGYKLKTTVEKQANEVWKLSLQLIWNEKGYKQSYNIDHLINE